MVPYALVGGALSRTRQSAVDNRLGSTATPITSSKRHREQRAHHCDRVTTTGDGTAGSAHRERQATGSAGVRGRRKAVVQHAGAAGLQDHGPAAPARTVKLGPIGARRVSAGLSFVQQNSGNALIFRRFHRFQQAEKATRHQVVWSWRQENFLNYFKGKFPFKSAGPD
jgi:hypothetical protein